ncbi:hypothetical protein [Salinisphaera sp. G21_0]|uniref:hypothetical protein n=1 Tax=Salinisphaera sp. G21_0 TaxID=2821094 RepID=UPI001ADA246C|nr:hypothetical protein [Salinisphaera sp. G21_0]MBO9482170.1 hypothetical protein [Salinisphaera sp. G21_0]
MFGIDTFTPVEVKGNPLSYTLASLSSNEQMQQTLLLLAGFVFSALQLPTQFTYLK